MLTLPAKLSASMLNKWREIWNRFSGRGIYPHQLALMLLMPLRSLTLSPRTLVARLHLNPDVRVLELGPGPGFFSVAVARAVPRGHLCLADIQREMLIKARRRIRRAGAGNVSCTQASASALPFSSGVFDVAFMVAGLGEVPDPAGCIRSIAQCLRPGGTLSISELPGDPDAMSAIEISALADAEGFERAETYPIRGGFNISFRKIA